MTESFYAGPSVYSYGANYYVAGGVGLVPIGGTPENYHNIINPSFYTCGDSLYLATPRYGLTNDSDLTYGTINSLNMLKDWGFIGSDIPNLTSGYSVAYKVDTIQNNTGGSYFTVDTFNPIITTDFVSENSCTTFTPATTSRGKIGFINHYSYSISGGSDSPSIPSDNSDIVRAILYIPATLVILCFFGVIFKMFVNRRTRG